MGAVVGILGSARTLFAAFGAVRRVCDTVKGIDDRLFLFVIEGVGLAVHQILKDFGLGFGYEAEIGRVGKLAGACGRERRLRGGGLDPRPIGGASGTLWSTLS